MITVQISKQAVPTLTRMGISVLEFKATYATSYDLFCYFNAAIHIKKELKFIQPCERTTRVSFEVCLEDDCQKVEEAYNFVYTMEASLQQFTCGFVGVRVAYEDVELEPRLYLRFVRFYNLESDWKVFIEDKEKQAFLPENIVKSIPLYGNTLKFTISARQEIKYEIIPEPGVFSTKFPGGIFMCFEFSLTQDADCLNSEQEMPANGFCTKNVPVVLNNSQRELAPNENAVVSPNVSENAAFCYNGNFIEYSKDSVDKIAEFCQKPTKKAVINFVEHLEYIDDAGRQYAIKRSKKDGSQTSTERRVYEGDISSDEEDNAASGEDGNCGNSINAAEPEKLRQKTRQAPQYAPKEQIEEADCDLRLQTPKSPEKQGNEDVSETEPSVLVLKTESQEREIVKTDSIGNNAEHLPKSSEPVEIEQQISKISSDKVENRMLRQTRQMEDLNTSNNESLTKSGDVNTTEETSKGTSQTLHPKARVSRTKNSSEAEKSHDDTGKPQMTSEPTDSSKSELIPDVAVERPHNSAVEQLVDKNGRPVLFNGVEMYLVHGKLCCRAAGGEYNEAPSTLFIGEKECRDDDNESDEKFERYHGSNDGLDQESCSTHKKAQNKVKIYTDSMGIRYIDIKGKRYNLKYYKKTTTANYRIPGVTARENATETPNIDYAQPVNQQRRKSSPGGELQQLPELERRARSHQREKGERTLSCNKDFFANSCAHSRIQEQLMDFSREFQMKTFEKQQ